MLGLTDAARKLAPIVVGSLIAAIILFQLRPATNTRFDEFALGEPTTSVFAEVGGQPIHGQLLDSVDDVLAGFRTRGQRDAVLWLGNSQLHAINQAGPDAATAAAKLHTTLAANGVDLLSFSQPNANLQEHYLMFAYLSGEVPVRLLLLPLVFDDLRETGVRDGIQGAFDDRHTRDLLSESNSGRSLLASYESDVGDSGDAAALEGTFQASSEAFLTGWLTENSRLWAARADLRGELFLSLYQFRNRVFGISAQTKRRVIPGRYQLNISALDAIISGAALRDIPVLMYIAPLRSDVETPYDVDEYEAFKAAVAEKAEASANVSLLNLEDLVPGELWGQMEDQAGAGVGLDFMHFQEGGHALLAEALAEPVMRRIEAKSRVEQQ